MITRMLNSGSFEPSEKIEGEIPASMDKKALLVYAGSFESMDGTVDIKPEMLTALADSHNSLFANLKRLAGNADVPLRKCPPIQLDHSRSARDTVGRLVGNLILGTHTLHEGETPVPALFGTVRILGQDNVERVVDGRWSELSIGADFEKNKLVELTITPFPAAAEASLLQQGDKKLPINSRERVFSEDFKSYKIAVYQNKSGDRTSFEPEIGGEEWVGDPLQFDSMELAIDWLKKQINGEFLTVPRESKLAADDGVLPVPPVNPVRPVGGDGGGSDRHAFAGQLRNPQVTCSRCSKPVERTCKKCESNVCLGCHKTIFGMSAAESTTITHLSQGESEMDKAKLKKHLMETTKCTEQEADAKLAEMPEEDQKKLATEADEQEKKLAADEDEKKKAELTARKEKITNLSSDFRKASEEIRLAAKKNAIYSRLMGLRAKAQITPAEMKKIDLAAMAQKPNEVVEEMLKTYSMREPVIPTGALGSVKAVDISAISEDKEARIQRMMSESRKNMSLLSRADANKSKSLQGGKKRLSDSTTESTESAQQLSGDEEYDNLCALMDTDLPKAKAHLRGLFDKMRSRMSEDAPEAAQDNAAEMAALVSKVEMMQNHCETILKLAEEQIG